MQIGDLQVGSLVQHRVSDRLGIIVSHTAKSHWKVIRWDNGFVVTEQLINLVLLCK
jgi:hypothetical protein